MPQRVSKLPHGSKQAAFDVIAERDNGKFEESKPNERITLSDEQMNEIREYEKLPSGVKDLLGERLLTKKENSLLDEGHDIADDSHPMRPPLTPCGTLVMAAAQVGKSGHIATHATVARVTKRPSIVIIAVNLADVLDVSRKVERTDNPNACDIKLSTAEEGRERVVEALAKALAKDTNRDCIKTFFVDGKPATWMELLTSEFETFLREVRTSLRGCLLECSQSDMSDSELLRILGPSC
jgi:hypothetical protein